jgi:ribosomal protein S18 acetylase RimI-like enzyme
MSFGEKVRHFERSRQQFAGDVAVADSLDVDEANRKVDELIDRLLPQGFDTPGHSFLWIVANDDQRRVGWTWVGPNLADSNAYYIWDIEINEAARGFGYARSALDQIENLAKEHRATRLGLHVFEDNHSARRLYESNGYAVISVEPGHIYMSKELDTPDGPLLFRAET